MSLHSPYPENRMLFTANPRIDRIRNWASAAALAAIIGIAGPSLDAHSAENPGKPSAPLVKKVKSEKKLPEIAMRNPQIYEFLDGHITQNDTLESIHKKLAKKFEYMEPLAENDIFTHVISMEIRYREKTGKSVGSILPMWLDRIKKEQRALRQLIDSFRLLHVDETEEANELLISYWNAIGGMAWTDKEQDAWKKQLFQERKSLGYNYETFVEWMEKMEGKEYRKNIIPARKKTT